MSVDNLVGQTLGQYQLRELLGAGGMGAVYLAYQANLKREVAVKVLPTGLAEQAGYIERFNREAEIAAKLEHPNIVPIYDYGTQNSISYVVMRRLGGGSLAQRLAPREDGTPVKPSVGETMNFLRQLASALDYAHSHQVVHRDIKPGNVMFDNHGSAYLVDFGIAKMLDSASNLTGTGMMVGTPSYMAPELWRGEQASPASDQYALAAMIYGMMAGRLPFEAPTPYSLMHKHMNEMPTPVQALRSDVPASLTPVLERALAKEPRDRFQTATAFAQAFEAAAEGAKGEPTGVFTAPVAPAPVRPPMMTPLSTPALGSANYTPNTFMPRPPTPLPAPPPAPRRQGPLLWVLIIVIVLLIAALIVLLINPFGGAASPTESVIPSATSAATAVSAVSTALPPTVNPVVIPTLEPTTLPILAEPSETATQVPLIVLAPTETASTAPTLTDTATEKPTETEPPLPTTAPSATSPPATAAVVVLIMTDTPTPAQTATPAPTETPLPTNTAAPTSTPVPTDTQVSIILIMPTDTAAPSNTPAPTEPPPASPSNAPTLTPVPTDTPIPTATTLPTQIPTDTAAPTNTPTDTATATLTPSATLTATELPTLTPTPTVAATPTTLPNAARLIPAGSPITLYSAPDTNSATLGQISDTLPRLVVGANFNYQYFLIQSGPLLGWVVAKGAFGYTGNIGSLPVVADQPPFVDAGKTTVTVYAEPKADAAELGTATNLLLLINGLSEQKDFVRVNYYGAAGWVPVSGTSISGNLNSVAVAPSGSPELTVGAQGVSVHSAPQDTVTNVMTSVFSTSLPITGITTDRQFWRVNVNGKEGWVKVRVPGTEARGDLSLVAVLQAQPSPTPAVSPTLTLIPIVVATPTAASTGVTASNYTNVNVRSGDGLNYPVIARLMVGMTAEVLGISSRGTGWYQIRLPDGVIGWVGHNVVQIRGDTSNLPLVSPPPAA